MDLVDALNKEYDCLAAFLKKKGFVKDKAPKSLWQAGEVLMTYPKEEYNAFVLEFEKTYIPRSQRKET